ncbi:hypothetical protein WICMUC_001842 [Wickerhamomyces mucosus]|uniref:E3 ubiquitin-protein ligase n=1 Tax=Wickerhamomyces mucosus TaxID=1378264 RepID=A0A9P8PRQ3_9ASCO|nr:hypothetical protein WICMUC_001842 [Wickerhamomyces mucosus]
MNMITLDDHAEILKKALLHLPRKYQYEYGEAAKVELLHLLSFAASSAEEFIRSGFSDESNETNFQNILSKLNQNPEYQKLFPSKEKKFDPSHPNRACGTKFKKGEPIYRCMTCGKDDSSGLCMGCYDEDDHIGHKVTVGICQRENGGVCDCGDEEAWVNSFHCKNKNVKEVPETEIPVELKQGLLQTIEISLDYIVDVMSGSISTICTNNDHESILKDSFNASLDQYKYSGTDWPSDKYYLMLYNDQNKQYRDAVHRISLATSKLPDFSYMIADEVNLRGRAKVLGSTQIEELLKAQLILESTGLPSGIRNARDIFREEMCCDILQWLTDLASGSIKGNYNIARDYLSKSFCKKWVVGVRPLIQKDSFYPGSLIDTKIPNMPIRPPLRDGIRVDNHWSYHATEWIVDDESAQECHYDKRFSMTEETNESFHGSRFQYLLYFDIRFWKAFRSTLHNLFNCVLASNKKYKSIICCQYVDIYPNILELFFLYDREPEYSCMTTLTSQIFTSVSNATMIVKHGDLTKLLAAAYGFLTKTFAVRPNEVDATQKLMVTSFKNRKISQVFYDICCVISKTATYDEILNSNIIKQVCDILSLFQGRPVVKREAHEHVEYESNDYGLYFNMYSIIGSLSEAVAKCLINASQEDSLAIINTVLEVIYNISNPANEFETSEDSDIINFAYKQIDTIEGPISIVDFKVHENRVSFLHPLHAFLAWLFQYSSIQPLRLFNSNNQFNINVMKEVMLEYPLRVMVMLSQVKVGFWVRNGMSIKSQLHIYQGSIRESGYKRDLQLIQLSLSLYDPTYVLSSIFNRWSLSPWIKENFGNHDVYDKEILPQIVEECLLFLLHLLSETGYLCDPEKTAEERIKRAVIHTLCFKPLSYSKLCSAIPDFLSNEKRFDLILNEVADFIPAKNSSRSGMYKLREEWFKNIDPFYLHYSSNKTEEAEILLKDLMAKKLKIKPSETYISPLVCLSESVVFKDLFKFTSSKIFLQFLRSTLKYVDKEGFLNTETMLNLTLQLIHISVEGKELLYATQFSEIIWSELIADHNEPFYYESVGSLLYKFLKDESFITFHPKIRAIFKSLKLKNRSVDSYLKEQVENFDPLLLGNASACVTQESEFEKKKKLAIARRAKILEKFKKQQTKFAELHQDENFESSDAEMTEISDKHWKYPEPHCILCQMDDENDSPFGIVTNISNTSTVRTVPFDDKFWSLKAFDTNNMDSKDCFEKESNALEIFLNDITAASIIGPSFPIEASATSNISATTCGHGMHYSCYKEYINSSKGRQTQITRTVPEDFENAEFTCPLCKSLGNTFIPIMWSHNKKRLNEFITPKRPWDEEYGLLKDLSCSVSSTILQATVELIESAKTTLIAPYNEILFKDFMPNSLQKIMNDLTFKVNKLEKPHFRDQMNKLISNTIRGMEVSLRGARTESGLIVNQISNQCLTSLRVMIELRNSHFATVVNREYRAQECTDSSVKSIEECLGRLVFLGSDSVFGVFEEIDFFEYIVSCVAINGISVNTIYRLGFTYFILQTVSTLLANLKEHCFEGVVSFFNIDLIKTSDQTLSNLLNLSRHLRDNNPIFDNLSDGIFEDPIFPSVIYTLLSKSITPFLRKIAIWSVGCCAEYSNVSFDFAIEDGLESTRLSKFLNLPTLDELINSFNDKDSRELELFRSYSYYIQTTDNDLRFTNLEYPSTVQLINLPSRLDDIFTKLIYKKEDLKEKIIDPAICLFCGKVMNLQKRAPGYKYGECNFHVNEECLSHVGMFLLPRHTSILLLYRGNGSFHPAPYIDHHGEFDSEIKQGQIMNLNKEKYDQFIRQLWLQNEAPNYITRKLEGVIDMGGWESL